MRRRPHFPHRHLLSPSLLQSIDPSNPPPPIVSRNSSRRQLRSVTASPPPFTSYHRLTRPLVLPPPTIIITVSAVARLSIRRCSPLSGTPTTITRPSYHPCLTPPPPLPRHLRRPFTVPSFGFRRSGCRPPCLIIPRRLSTIITLPSHRHCRRRRRSHQATSLGGPVTRH